MSQRNRLTRSQQAVVNRMMIDFDRLWATYSRRPPVEFEAALHRLLPALADKYGRLAGAAAADWYEETRQRAIGGDFESLVVRANLDAVRGSVDWLGGRLRAPSVDLDAVKRAAAASMERHVRNAGRDTIMDSVSRDPARPRWARAMRGVETCGWCRMLASRGFVYASEESAGGTHDWHDNDDCEAIPEFSLNDAERAAYDREVAELEAQYFEVRERVGSTHPTDAEIAAEWNRSMIDYDHVREQLAKDRSGATKDGTLQQHTWDQYRREQLARLEREHPDGYVGMKRLPPRNPLQAPDWPADLPELRARELNHAVYGDRRGGGHLAGHGWGHERPEFPASATPAWLADAAEEILRTAREIPAKGLLSGTVDGVDVTVAISTKRGRQYVASIFPTSSANGRLAP